MSKGFDFWLSLERHLWWILRWPTLEKVICRIWPNFPRLILPKKLEVGTSMMKIFQEMPNNSSTSPNELDVSQGTRGTMQKTPAPQQLLREDWWLRRRPPSGLAAQYLQESFTMGRVIKHTSARTSIHHDVGF
ncbi:hypothetical protein VNO80_23324 [Phaseolus coccineus]|uniref:Uncharacterized protein n=1 Tax=Phaseolus coccineus TaxID=3886 RepID=A0AAN9MBC6_PHACN